MMFMSAPFLAQVERLRALRKRQVLRQERDRWMSWVDSVRATLPDGYELPPLPPEDHRLPPVWRN